MPIREFLAEVAATYDRTAGMQAPAQKRLSEAPAVFSTEVPAGFLVKTSKGQGNLPFAPWIGIFDPDVSTTPQQGLYLVYLFAVDLKSVVLSLNQGTESVDLAHGRSAARTILKRDARTLRDALDREGVVPATFGLGFDLGKAGWRQRHYEAADIASRTYATDALPDEAQLQVDLRAALEVLAMADNAKNRLLITKPGTIASPGAPEPTDRADPGFNPKDDSSYIAHFESRSQTKSRRHETLVRHLGEAAQSVGLVAQTPHPEDLIIRSETGEPCVIEVKVVRNGDVTAAVREAIGQLFTYRYFLHRNEEVELVGAFSEPIGDAYLALLNELAISAVWWQDGALHTNSASLAAIAQGSRMA